MTDAPVGFEGIDMSDPYQALAWALGSMPSHQTGGIPVPIPPKVVPAWSKFLTDLGLEYNPAKQRLFPITSANPDMGWLSPVQWVNREEYDRHQAEKQAKADGIDLEQMLATFNPGLAQRIADMTDVEKRDAMAAQAHKFASTFDQIQRLRSGTDTDPETPTETQ
ncbi:DUF2744 domain-containing protein [Nocardia panacis]|uniref:DUF2744 domain-containing protein n=1 Tax=Nocardia panacis TaxID=2340916 RepID=A0A3A4K664_9NOCA|nr:DUF2744 domain-containing protein [Nocardia panacis]RJO74178.1 DUF2744 domain-containing protein [Nocardia panacis]